MNIFKEKWCIHNPIGLGTNTHVSIALTSDALVIGTALGRILVRVRCYLRVEDGNIDEDQVTFK